MIAVSEFSADELIAHTPIRREQIRVVPNGVELCSRRPTTRSSRGAGTVGIG